MLAMELILLLLCFFLTTNGHNVNEHDPRPDNNKPGAHTQYHKNSLHQNYTSYESKLLRTLIKRYQAFGSLTRPTLNSNNSIVVTFSASLFSILDLDEKDQVISTLMWKQLNWTDEILTWEPKEFGGLTSVRLPSSAVWTPDIILYNNVNELKKIDAETEYMLVVESTGRVMWIPPVIQKSSCTINMIDFPWDRHECSFKFGSWTYDQAKLDLIPKDGNTGFDLEVYKNNSEWQIIKNTWQRNIITYACCDDVKYPDVTFNLTLQRVADFYIQMQILPTILLTILTLAIFWIPPHRPDRTALGMSLFGAFFLLLLIVVQSSPPTSTTRLGMYCGLNLVLLATATVLSVCVVNITSRKDKPPAILRHIFIDWLGSLLCLCDGHSSCPCRRHNTSSSPDDVTRMTGVALPLVNNSDMSRDGDMKPPDSNSQPMNAQLEHGEVHARLHERRVTQDHCHIWLLIGRSIDRLLFYVYLVVVIVAAVYILPRPPPETALNGTL